MYFIPPFDGLHLSTFNTLQLLVTGMMHELVSHSNDCEGNCFSVENNNLWLRSGMLVLYRLRKHLSVFCLHQCAHCCRFVCNLAATGVAIFLPIQLTTALVLYVCIGQYDTSMPVSFLLRVALRSHFRVRGVLTSFPLYALAMSDLSHIWGATVIATYSCVRACVCVCVCVCVCARAW